MQLLTNVELYNFINEKYSRLNFYDFYEKYVEIELKETPISKENFDKFFNLKFEKEFKYNDFKDEEFNLIIASKIIHYEELKNPKKFIEECIQLLSENGLIYISFPTTSGKRKISREEFEEIIENISDIKTLEIIEIMELDKEITIIFKGMKTNN